MRAWGYYAFHTFVNSIKKIFRSKFLIIFICCLVFFSLIGFASGFIFSILETSDYTEYSLAELEEGQKYLLLDDNNQLVTEREPELYKTSSGNYLVDSKGDFYVIAGLSDLRESFKEDLIEEASSDPDFTNLEDYTWTASDFSALDIPFYSENEHKTAQDETASNIDISATVEAVAGALLIVLLLWAIYSGAKKGSDIFLMADVNFMFKAPLKPQTVLFFRLSFQLATVFVSCIYLLFQVPSLMLNGLTLSTIFICYAGLFIVLITQKFVSVLTYTLVAERPALRKNVPTFIIVVACILAAVNIYKFRQLNYDLYALLNTMYGPKVSRNIPVFGWFKGFIGCFIEGDYLHSLIYVLLFVITIVTMVILTWKLPADFYEDSIVGAEKRDQAMQMASTRNKSLYVREKTRSSKIKRNTGMKGFGASTFFYKEIYNRRRMSKLGIFTTTMLTYLGCALVFAMFVIFGKADNMGILCGMLSAVLFFRGFKNPLAQDSQNIWLVLVPEDSNKKMFFSLLGGTVSCMIDLLPAFLISFILVREKPVIILMWYLTLVSIDFMLTAVTVMLDALIPIMGMVNIKQMVQMMIRITIAMILVLSIALGYLFLNLISGLFVAILLCLAFGTLAFIVYPLKLDRGL